MLQGEMTIAIILADADGGTDLLAAKLAPFAEAGTA